MDSKILRKVDVFLFSLCDFAKTRGRGVFGWFFNDPFLVHWFSLVDAEWGFLFELSKCFRL